MKMLFVLLLFPLISSAEIFTPPSRLGPVKSIYSTKFFSFCAIKMNDEVSCWPRVQVRSVPLDLGSVKSLSTQTEHACAIDLKDEVRCWGYAYSANTPQEDKRTVPASLGKVLVVGAGRFRDCAITADLKSVCWSEKGMMTDLPPEFLGATSLFPNSVGACALGADQLVKCFNEPGAFYQVQAPTTKAKKMDFDGTNGCIITLDDTVECFGSFTEDSKEITKSLGKVKDMTVANYEGCAVKMDGSVVCWIMDKYPKRARLPAPEKMIGIAVGPGALCGIAQSNHQVVCW